MSLDTNVTFTGLLRFTLTVSIAIALAACHGSSGTSEPPPEDGAELRSVHFGRLVDVLAYRRIDSSRTDRRDTANREPVRVLTDVVIRADIGSTPLFDAGGNARSDADYRMLPFDVAVGHEELLILWDDQAAGESTRFDLALQRASAGLSEVPASFRDQNTRQRPIPLVPRNAAIVLTFDRDLGVDSAFFAANPEVVQVLEFITPLGGKRGFRPVLARIIADRNRVVIDTSLVGGEATGGRNTDGLPPSLDNSTANIRIALPTSGVVTRLLKFARDPVTELNGPGLDGEQAVIRDLRSGNLKDGPVGALSDFEPPMLVAHLEMGITEIDEANRILTVNKRNLNAAIRGRVPYVDGAIDSATGLAGGPEVLPATHPLRAGDVVVQTVLGTDGAPVRIRAEVVMNLDVGSTFTRNGGKIEVDPEFKGLGMHRRSADPMQNPDGGQEGLCRLKVTNLTAIGRNGDTVAFKASSLPLGETCDVLVHYYENVPYRLAYAGALDKVSDAGRRNSFLTLDPAPPAVDANGRVNPDGLVDPRAAVALRFSEPMNIESVEAYENLMLTNRTIQGSNLAQMLKEPKPLALSLLGADLRDHNGDGTLLQLRPPMGHYHKSGDEERYWCHMVLGGKSPRDMAGNPVDLYDRTTDPLENFSVSYTMDPQAGPNWVGYRVLRFAAQDEDGSAPGSADAFGQFQLRDGELRALPVTRFSAVADRTSLQGITRFDHGECDAMSTGTPPVPVINTAGATSVLYQCPSETANGVTEPHNQRGSRLQLTYREDDFGLGYRDPNRHLIDVEQLHWAPFNDMAVRFDVFDRYTIRVAHCDKRPDMTNWYPPTGGACQGNGFASRSGLELVFDDNVLAGTTYETLVKDKVYEINPNDAFRATTGTKFHPYPRFAKTYTWRDPRLIQWDTASGTATGFGGARRPADAAAQRDNTACVSSPYVPDLPTSNATGNFRPLHANHDFVLDYGDFIGFRTRDHSPLALPLLVDLGIYPDGPENGGAAKGTNLFHIAEIGPCHPGSGYYNQVPQGFLGWPNTRAHASGGIDPISGLDIYVDPDTQIQAKESMITDALLGTGPKLLFKAPPRDDHVHWAQADFLRRMSMVTFGFFDTRRPNAHDFTKLQTNWPGRGSGASNGIPDFSGNTGAQGVVDLVTMMDPPLSRQPVGTSVVLEIRGAEELAPDHGQNRMFDQPTDLLAVDNVALVKQRGNLLNPFYACEAYRYALPNPFDVSFSYHPIHTASWSSHAGARVPAKGLTPYVTEDRLDSIRLPNELLPRYLNFRVVFGNNTAASPPISPVLRSFAVGFRLGEPK